MSSSLSHGRLRRAPPPSRRKDASGSSRMVRSSSSKRLGFPKRETSTSLSMRSSSTPRTGNAWSTRWRWASRRAMAASGSAPRMDGNFFSRISSSASSTKPGSRWWMKELLRAAHKRGIPTQVPYRRLKPEEQRFVMEGGGAYEGVKGFFDWLKTKNYKVQVRVFLSRYRKYVPCPSCGGMRLNPRALSVRVAGRSIGEVTRMTVKEGAVFCRDPEPH